MRTTSYIRGKKYALTTDEMAREYDRLRKEWQDAVMARDISGLCKPDTIGNLPDPFADLTEEFHRKVLELVGAKD